MYSEHKRVRAGESTARSPGGSPEIGLNR